MRGVVPRGFGLPLPSPIPPHPGEAALTEARASRFRQVLARRTGRLAVVVEECHDPQNATAVMRTCDCLGIHRVHVVAGRNRFKVNPRVSQGVHRYIDLRIHAEIGEAYAALRADGFAIYATDLAADAVVGPTALRSVMARQPLAVVFGNEGFGLSEEASTGADGRFLLPMVGFAQSLNLSVSAAITLYALRAPELEADAPGDLPPVQQSATFDDWIRRHRTAAVMADAAAKPGLDRRGEALDVYGGKDAGEAASPGGMPPALSPSDSP
jgi:tRNA (guanosine-2'-O-)-methyltransferase